jgi:hypothetical protein
MIIIQLVININITNNITIQPIINLSHSPNLQFILLTSNIIIKYQSHIIIYNFSSFKLNASHIFAFILKELNQFLF